MKFFLVEDSESIRNVIRSTVEENGFRVIGEAASQQEAIEGIAMLLPDVVVVDLNLAFGSGVKVIQRIRKNNPQMVLIVFSGQINPVYDKVCKDVGADYVFQKNAEDFQHFQDLLKDMQQNQKQTYSSKK